jgi:hypothetical protein
MSTTKHGVELLSLTLRAAPAYTQAPVTHRTWSRLSCSWETSII